MNIDERLERLTERTEALTQSVELLSHMHQDNERYHKANEKRYNDYFQVVSESLRTLTRIAEVHEDRIKELENGRGS